MKKLLASKKILNTSIGSATVALLGTLMLSACTSDSASYAINTSPNQLVFPNINAAWQKQGLFPNIENLSKVKVGLAKDELYYLIGRPHFNEGIGDYEWDYIMKFHKEDNSVKVCQYKLLFDKNYLVKTHVWYPKNCAQHAKPKIKERIIIKQPVHVPIIQQQPLPVHQPQFQVTREKLTLDADTLFAFDKSHLKNMQPQGRIELDNIVNKLRQFSTQGEIKVYITGHTDYKGSSEYNYDLSQRRANTVLQYLANKGINRSVMTASGSGEDFPIKQCPRGLSRSSEIACLQDNRRVEIEVVIHQQRRTLVSPTVVSPVVGSNSEIKNAYYVPSETNLTYANNPVYQKPLQRRLVVNDNTMTRSPSGMTYITNPNVSYTTTQPNVNYIQGQPQTKFVEPMYIQR